MITKFFHWDGEKLTSTAEEWGTILPDCTEEIHHFRRAHCNCDKQLSITKCRMKQAVRESPAKLKEEPSANHI